MPTIFFPSHVIYLSHWSSRISQSTLVRSEQSPFETRTTRRDFWTLVDFHCYSCHSQSCCCAPSPSYSASEQEDFRFQQQLQSKAPSKRRMGSGRVSCSSIVSHLLAMSTCHLVGEEGWHDPDRPIRSFDWLCPSNVERRTKCKIHHARGNKMNPTTTPEKLWLTVPDTIWILFRVTLDKKGRMPRKTPFMKKGGSRTINWPNLSG